jgi:hypothetical protein
MKLTLQPVRVATGIDEEGMLVFDAERRLVAVLTRLTEHHEAASGTWFLEAGFGQLERPDHSTFADLDAAQAWINQCLVKAH